ncbi:MAG: PAS domain-containing protein [Rectinemataceae bacterium]
MEKDEGKKSLRRKAEALPKDKSEAEMLKLLQELAFQNNEKAKRTDELLLANKELAFQFEEKAKRAAELIIANKELAFQIEEKAKRAAELILANKELAFQNEEKSKRAGELIIANKELALEQDYQRKIAGLLPGVVYQYRLRPDGSSCFPYTSDAIKEIYRVSPEEVREDASAVIEKYHPDDRAGILDSILTSARDLSPWQHEYRVKFNDGTIRTHYSNAMPLKEEDGSVLWHGFIMDVTELSQATEALRKSETKFRKVADFTNDWEYWVEADGQIIYISPSCERISGYRSEEFLSDRSLLESIVHPGDARLYADHSAYIESREHRHEIDEYVFRILKKDGSIAHIGHLSRPVSDDKGNYEGRRVSNRDITASMQIKENMEFISAQLALATRAGGVGLWDYDIGKNMLGWDDQIMDLYGIDKHDFKGSYEYWLAAIHPEDKERVNREIEMAIRGEHEYDTEYRIVWPNGAIRCIRTLALVQRDIVSGRATRMIGTKWDITEQRRAEKVKLDDSESRFRSIFQGSPDGIMIVDAESKSILFANPMQCKLLGYSEFELKMMNISAIHPGYALEEALLEFEGLMNGEKSQSENIPCLKKDGEVFYSDIAANTMIIGGQKCIVGFFRDVTQRRQAEVELREALAQAEASNRMKTAFINTISHEVRTPLNGIMGFGNLLNDPGLTSEVRQQYNQYIEASGSRLINTIADYIDVSLIAAGSIHAVFKPVKVNGLLEEMSAKYQNICDLKQLDLRLVLPDGGDNGILNTDSQLLRKTLSCLLDNSIKFTSHGSIAFGYSVTSSAMEFFVNDTGIGVAHEFRKLMFDPFTQEDVTNSRGYEGSGLGLFISKSFLKLLGSELYLESAKGMGTAFSFSLPLEPVSTKIDPARRWSDMQRLSGSFQPGG